VDCTILTAVNHIASQQANPSERVLKNAFRVLEYLAAYPQHCVVYHACDMILHIQSDASYLSRSNGRSVAGGIHYCGNRNEPTLINGAILAMSSIIPTVVSSVAEAEYAGCFMNAQHGVWLRTILIAMGYPQPPTFILCDNMCAVGIATDTVKAKRSKAIDMRYHWVRDRIRNGQFVVTWIKGADNLADFFTKALPVHRHQAIKLSLVHSSDDTTNPSLCSRARRSQVHRVAREVKFDTRVLRGCVDHMSRTNSILHI
jgi:hypothetical protein